jgi:hypothetical protein
MQSEVLGVTTIAACLKKAEDFLGPNRMYRGVNPEQKRFLTVYKTIYGSLEGMKDLSSEASRDYQVINAFLESNGLDIRLEEFDESSFGVASVLDLMVDWRIPGERVKMKAADGNTYDSVKITHATLYKVPGEKEQVVRLDTKSDDVVYLMMTEPLKGLDIYERAHDLSAKKRPHTSMEVRFPMVDLDIKPDISWILEMNTDDISGQYTYVSQAVQQVKLKVNELGAHLKEGTAMAMRCLGVSDRYTVDRPFLIWFEKPGLSYPLFAGFIGTDSWKDPGRQI